MLRGGLPRNPAVKYGAQHNARSSCLYNSRKYFPFSESLVGRHQSKRVVWFGLFLTDSCPEGGARSFTYESFKMFCLSLLTSHPSLLYPNRRSSRCRIDP